MDKTEALTGAIYLINTFLHPEASDDAEVDRIEQDADEILYVLEELRDSTVKLELTPEQAYATFKALEYVAERFDFYETTKRDVPQDDVCQAHDRVLAALGTSPES